MSGQFLDLVKIAGITVLVTAFWAASVALAYWDLHRQGRTGASALAWIAVVALLPLIGFAAYGLVRAVGLISAASAGGGRPTPRRETALKRPAAGRGATSTLVAADLARPTIADPKSALPAGAGKRQTPPKYRVVVASGADQGKAYVVESLPVQIGRGFDTAIRLDGDLGVSRRHAEIYEHGGALRIRDLQSTHGTQLNGLHIADKPLAPGDVIQVGLSTLVLSVIEG